MITYAFGAGGFKLGERVEILTTGQKGILISEMVHISGCNTFQILLPNVLTDGKMKITHRDYLMLKRLEQCESIYDTTKVLTDENSYSPSGVNANADQIRAAMREQKELIPEIDDAADAEEIVFRPGMEVWNKVYGKTMIISLINRDIYAKELSYGATYMVGEKEEVAFFHANAFVPLEQKLNVPSAEKTGAVFEDSRDLSINKRNSIVNALNDF